MTEGSASTPQIGTVIVVVGASGAGKDTLLAYAARHLAQNNRVHFVRRWITRPADAGGEDHYAVTAEEFLRHEAAGGFAVSWQAHGLYYGIPGETLALVRKGHCLVTNGSRAALESFAGAYANVLVAEITARPEILAERLKGRGRETEAEIESRLNRATLPKACRLPLQVIDNSGDVQQGGQLLVDLILATIADKEPKPNQ